MAASAAYISITRVPNDGTARDSASFTNIGATTAAFNLKGGTYTMDVVATFAAGTVTLQRLGPDGSTMLTALTAFSANGTANVTLPAGSYKVALA